MSRTITSYCSCSTCTQIRNEQPKHYRYINYLRDLFTCSFCLPKRKLMMESRMSTITFRDTDITNKHCSKHDVLVKATRPNFSRIKNEEVRQRVKEANQRWIRMSILPTNLIDFIFENKDLIPLCSICYENLSPTTFNLCYTCITTLIHYHQQLTINRHYLPQTNIFNYNNENVTDDIQHFFLDYLRHESIPL